MVMKKINKKILIPVCSVLIIAIVAAVLIIPGRSRGQIKAYSYAEKSQQGVEFSTDFEPCITLGKNVLYVNKSNGAVAIKSENGEFFNSLSDDAAGELLASVISLTLRDKAGNSYQVNSTDNSVRFGTFEIDKSTQNAVKITFRLFKDNESSSKGSQAAFYAEIPLELSSQGSAFKVAVDIGKVILADGLYIEKISILPGLFSESEPQEDCFYTVPDGSGAQIDLSAFSEEALELSLDVYGSDVTYNEYAEGANLPCFAFTKGKTLATVIIDDGDALSTVTATRFAETGGNLYNTFTVTSCGTENGKFSKGVSYNGVVSQLYYLSGGAKNDYNAISSVVRENLISRGYLPSEMSSTFSDYPFFITVVGSESGNKKDVYTTFENAAEMIALLKSRGVRSMAVRFTGASVKGLNTESGKTAYFSDVLGGSEGFNDFCNTAFENNSSVWYDVNLASEKAKKGDGTELYSVIRSSLGLDYSKATVSSYSSVENNISSVYKTMSEFENANVCINDLSFLLYTDTSAKADRQTALENLRDKLVSLSVSGGLMLTSPAVYLMSAADAVSGLPETASCHGANGVTSVPLIQMVLHGSVCYGSEPVNLSSDYSAAVLKAVEYGASPSFVYTYNGSESLDYGVYAAQTAKYYSQVKRMLPLMGMEITSHEQVVSGVYKITYDYNKVVYVNYNPSVVEVDGIYVYENDFVII